MPVFVDRQQFIPGKTAQIEAILFGGNLEFAAKRRQADIAVGDDGLVLQDDIDLALSRPNRRQGGAAELAHDRRYLLRLCVETCRENDPNGVCVDLFPFQRGRVAAELLGGSVFGQCGRQACR
jgi:hypothetical protein